MHQPNYSKLAIPAAIVGSALIIGFVWRTLGSKPMKASVGVERSVSVERAPRPVVDRDVDLVSVSPMETPQEQQARSIREKAEAAAAEPVVQEGPDETAQKSMELVVQIPAKNLGEGVSVRVVLDQAKGRGAPADWTSEVEVPSEQKNLLFEDLPSATSFRLQVYVDDALYARTTIQTNNAQLTTVELDFEANEKEENTAIATLRSIAAAQQQLQASAAIDTNADGGGEHGYFAELAGTKPVRSYSTGGATLDPNGIKLDPTYLPESMGTLEPASQGGAMVREGYAYMIHLPDDSTSAPFLGIAESAEGGSTLRLPGSNNAEVMWCCYAWPLVPTTPMKRAFMINQAGDVIGTANDSTNPYVGLDSAPAFDAAFSVPGDMGSEPALTSLGLVSADRRVWAPVGN